MSHKVGDAVRLREGSELFELLEPWADLTGRVAGVYDGGERIIRASTSVRPFGTAYHALHMVTTAIDTLAFFITGQQHFYAITGSTPAHAPQMPETAKPTALRPDDADEP